MGKEYLRSVGYRNKKRHFHGRKRDSTSDVFEGKSASAKKLKLDTSTDMDKENKSGLHGYRFIDVGILFKELSSFLCCKQCHSKVTFSEEAIRGSASVFCVTCQQCESIKKINSCPMIGKKYNIPEVNIRLIYGMRCIGQGLTSLRTFCGIMNMLPPVAQNSFDANMIKIKRATQTVAENSMKSAAKEESKYCESSDICVSGDGTWKTRGHTSKIGVCSVIGLETGKVIDIEVLSSICKVCDSDISSSKDHECKKNHNGSSGAMEVIGMQRIFLRSVKNRKVRYTKYLGDGDTKTFSNLTKARPYEEVEIEKLECIGHVQKRMGARLRKLKLQSRGTKLSDGKTLSGKGRLTDSLIDKLTVYYGNAIRSNTHSLQNMREAIWATYCHMSSSDEEPMHMFCPAGENSWCKYNKHAASTDAKKGKFQHKPIVAIEVMKKIKAIYADLSAPNLLKRCLSGKTQNPNESFNSVIWKFCPKTSGCGKLIAEVAVFEAVTTFNEGNSGRLSTLRELGIKPGEFTSTAVKICDIERVRTADKRADLRTLEARRAKRMKEINKNEHFIAVEGISYGPGEF